MPNPKRKKKPTTKDVKKKLCPRCNKNEALKPHYCPYQSEINGDYDTKYCTCCEDCRYDCAMDI